MTVVPRWEWRSFGEHLGESGTGLAELPVQQVVDSSELYLLATPGTDLVKVRDGLMDIKHLQRVGDGGLELWNPVLKAAFPLSATDVAAVAAAWGVEAPTTIGEQGLSLDGLLEHVVAPNPRLRAVEVRKHRQRYQLRGCLAEVTDVRTDHGATRTVAIESEDPAAVVATLAELGLAGRPNVNYGRGLKVLEHFGTERFAVIDVGTNSVKLHVGERSADGAWRRIADRSVITRLGDGLRQTGRLGTEPMERTVDAIAQMLEEAREDEVDAVAAVGTAGLRIAENGRDFVHTVRERCDLLVEVISGEEETRLAYLAATAGLPATGSRVVFDTGGGSSQFTFGHGGRVDEMFSVDVGAVRFTEQFGLGDAVSEATLAAALAAISGELGRLEDRGTPDDVLAIGGAATNLAAVSHALADYDPDVVQGTVLDLAEIDRQIELYRTRPAAERRSITGLQPARAEVILAGACVVRTVLDKLGKDSLTVSDRGLRHGVLAERFAATEVV
ncbi:Ppx/GppA family phosphatase [Nocardioides sp. CER19]|uniref:Ppx/GppA phosphatase family protein n=1 Tax=Nocardioides sp. CER19 TaxID=3038538 RepID=UPI00244CEE2A|nr:Ppx/GppA family phosphatase [Nocardioides sp. CER19]MDH2413978.1 Ppx/GppA family phosphatase [Nocardioides sp. CER19]